MRNRNACPSRPFFPDPVRVVGGARQPVEITARNDHFLAPEIGDDALLGATLLAYVLDLPSGCPSRVSGPNQMALIAKKPNTLKLPVVHVYYRANFSKNNCVGRDGYSCFITQKFNQQFRLISFFEFCP
jgi:hypothetical protein